MDSSKTLTCELCHQPAVCHMTIVRNGVTTRRHLCEGCFGQSAGPLVAEMQTARCRFCGGAPCGRGIDIFATESHAAPSYVCVPCQLEYSRFILPELESISSDLTPTQHLEGMARVCDKLEAHMTKWLAEKSKHWS